MKTLLILLLAIIVTASAAEQRRGDALVAELDGIRDSLSECRQSLQAYSKNPTLREGDATTVVAALNVQSSAAYYVATIRRIRVTTVQHIDAKNKQHLKALLVEQSADTERELQTALDMLNGLRTFTDNRPLLDDLGQLRGIISKLKKAIATERLVALPD